MAWEWILKRLTAGTPNSGLWAYLASRDKTNGQIKIEKARAEGTVRILEHLPAGAVFREGTPDGWREIQMPGANQQAVFVRVEPAESARADLDAPEPPKPRQIDASNQADRESRVQPPPES
jgi:hypothetical protein